MPICKKKKKTQFIFFWFYITSCMKDIVFLFFFIPNVKFSLKVSGKFVETHISPPLQPWSGDCSSLGTTVPVSIFLSFLLHLFFLFSSLAHSFSGIISKRLNLVTVLSCTHYTLSHWRFCALFRSRTSPAYSCPIIDSLYININWQKKNNGLDLCLSEQNTHTSFSVWFCADCFGHEERVSKALCIESLILFEHMLSRYAEDRLRGWRCPGHVGYAALVFSVVVLLLLLKELQSCQILKVTWKYWMKENLQYLYVRGVQTKARAPNAALKPKFALSDTCNFYYIYTNSPQI